MSGKKFEKIAADVVRVLSAEAIQKAKSGHPGMPLGCADFAMSLFYKHMKHAPANPDWLGRDRFILSAGHGSMLLYSLLHLFDYGLPMEELKEFRQWGSLTPGHPEYGHTTGVEITTGPLGSGFASAVGMAMSAKYLAAATGADASGLLDNKFYIISGDGCMMEGSTSEAASLAGHQKLDNLVCFYDDNSITIEGSTSLAFSENVAKRFEAYNWRVLHCYDANDPEKVDAVLTEAKESDGRPTIIIGKTQIGFGAPNKQGKASAHGEPLGDDELIALKKNLGLDDMSFSVPEEVSAGISARVAELNAEAEEWRKLFDAFLADNPEVEEKLSAMLSKKVPENILEELLAAAPTDKAVASRASGGAMLQKAAELVPALYGGAADLSPSTKTDIKNAEGFSEENRSGRNFHFGVRELAMGLCGNGMALYGSCIPYTSTFFVFSDYMKPAIRLAAIQNLHEIYVFTHDSFYVGEDGPTHEPIEQIAMLRSIPGLTVIRPGEANEVAHAWATALYLDGPVVLLFTRQNLEPLADDMSARIAMEKGAYVISEDDDFEMIIIATGSELNTALGAAKILRGEGEKIRVVSMPSQELFINHNDEYRESVLPSTCLKRVSVEAGSTFGWCRFVGLKGLAIGIDHFGASAPYAKLAEEYGFTPDQVVAKIEEQK
ncbi:MAG: transketolase [Victivallales bacterium]|nr:transketolase [Victivallales bacterium]